MPQGGLPLASPHLETSLCVSRVCGFFTLPITASRPPHVRCLPLLPSITALFLSFENCITSCGEAGSGGMGSWLLSDVGKGVGGPEN